MLQIVLIGKTAIIMTVRRHDSCTSRRLSPETPLPQQPPFPKKRLSSIKVQFVRDTGGRRKHRQHYDVGSRSTVRSIRMLAGMMRSLPEARKKKLCPSALRTSSLLYHLHRFYHHRGFRDIPESHFRSPGFYRLDLVHHIHPFDDL